MPERSIPRPPGRVPPGPRPVFQPRFTLSLLYLVGFFLLFGTLLALPELLEGARSLPPAASGSGGLTPAELERAERVGREALSRAELLGALLAALAATILGARSGRLPGLGAR